MNRVFALIMLIAIAGCSGESSGPTAEQAQAVAFESSDDSTKAPTFAGVMEQIATGRSFAGMPDRGELFAYAAQKSAGGARSVRHDGAYTWHRVDLSEEHAFHALVNGRLRVRTPTGELLDIVYDKHEEYPSGDWTWVGHLSGQPGVQTILTFGVKAVFGSIGQAGKRPLRVTTKQGSAWLVETDPQMLAGIASAGANPSKADYLVVPAAANRSRAQALGGDASAPVGTNAIAAAAGTTIDVMVGYTPGFVTENGGISAARTRINYLAAVANQGLSNSQVNASIRIVHSLQVDYTDNTTNRSALEDLTGYDTSRQEYTTPNAAFNALRQAREQYGADLVTLMRGFRDPEQDGCGIAWLIGGGRSGVLAGDDYFGYSVVSDGDDANEDDGETYFCRDESFIHELAHNLGSQHDRETAQGDDGTLDPEDYGIFAYSFGLKTSVSAGNFFTIMSYGDQGQTDFRVFSNPRITFCGGRACGTTQFEDNARSLGQTVTLVAGFRPTMVPGDDTPSRRLVVAGNFNGDGRYDIFWRNLSSGANVIWRSASYATQTAVTPVGNLDWQSVATGDFNGDGRSDLVWRHATNGKGAIWLSGSAASQLGLTTVTDTGWRIVGAGDFNRDGRSDIVWRHASNGRNAIWLSGNFATQLSIGAVSDAGWEIVGVGDVNADGRSDLVWRHAGNGRNTIWLSGNGSTQQQIANVNDGRWKIVGVGDFNGDGRDDLLWRHDLNGRNTIWLSGNASTQRSVATVTDAGWQVASIGDFNGDGRSDILWRHARTGHNVIWRSADSTAQQAVTDVTNLSWNVVG